MSACLAKRFACSIAVLVGIAWCQPGYAQFGGTLDLTSNYGDWHTGDPPVVIPAGALVTITTSCAWTNVATNPGDNITRIQLNWSNSSSALNLATSGTWTWNANTDGIAALSDIDLSDGKVNRQGAGIAPASPFDIGTLTFNAPMVDGTYEVNLTGGSLGGGTASVLADGTVYLYDGNNLTLDTFQFAVPEPATLTLLVAGGLAVLFRRRRPV